MCFRADEAGVLNEKMNWREAVLARYAVRSFQSRPVDREVIFDLLVLANQAPSSFNLQPWHFLVVDDPAGKARLRRLALDQPHVEQAAAAVVFCADPLAWRLHGEATTRQAVACRALPPEKAARRLRHIRLSFDIGPLGLLGLLKGLVCLLLKPWRPIPPVVCRARHLRSRVREETMLAVQTFMLAAGARGLDTCPVGAFDALRIKRAFGIPRRMEVVLLVLVGHGAETGVAPFPRLPVIGKTHWNSWDEK